MKTISNRYVIEDAIIELNSGLLHKGQDLSLNRIVFIYIIPNQGDSFREQYLVHLGNTVEGSTQAQFTQVLDAVFDEDHIYVILKYQEGRSMQQVIRKNGLDFQEAAALIADLGKTLETASEERTLDFSLRANNLWLGMDQKISVINTWEKADSGHRAAKDLSGLLFQLLTHRNMVTTQPELYAAQLHGALKALPVEQQETVVTAMTNANNERLSLEFFTHCLKDLLHDVEEEQPESAAPVYQAVSYTPSSKKIVKRVFATASLGLLSLAVFVGAFVVLIQLKGHKQEAISPEIATNINSSSPVRPNAQVNPQTERKQAAAQDSSVAVLTDNGIPVPSLTGLSKEAAEKQALSSGLRYTYYLEENNLSSGTVFKQEPLPNEPAVKGSRVTFWVSKGQNF